jgi:hypothetical protein
VREVAAGRARDHSAARGKNIRSQISIACRWQERRPRLAGGDFSRSLSYGQRVVIPVDTFNRTDAIKKAITSKVPLSGGPVDSAQLLRSVAQSRCSSASPARTAQHARPSRPSWLTLGKAHREQMLSALTGSGHPTRERSRSGSQLQPATYVRRPYLAAMPC